MQMNTHSLATSGNLALVWIRNTQKSNRSKIWAGAIIQPVAVLMEWWNAAPCSLALDVVRRTIALKNAKHKTGDSIKKL
jgi:hypothetical protein